MEEPSETNNPEKAAASPITGQEAVSQTTDNQSSVRAYKIFTSSIQRANNLLKINSDLQNNSIAIPEDKLLDSYRAVIVLSISALDAYIKTFLYTATKQFANKLLKSDEFSGRYAKNIKTFAMT